MNRNTFWHLFEKLDISSSLEDQKALLTSVVSADLLPEDAKRRAELHSILSLICSFGNRGGYEYVSKNLEYFKISQTAQSIHIDPTFIQLTTSCGDQFTLLKLSEVFPELLNNLPNLETEKRSRMCHFGAMKLAELCEDRTLKIVTGYVSGLSEKTKYLHSWVEFTAFGKEYVMDYTLNLLMQKQDYHKMRSVSQICCTVTRNEYLADKKLFEKYDILNSVTFKGYLVFRHEIMREYNKIESREHTLERKN